MRSWMGIALFLGVGAKEAYGGVKRKIDNAKWKEIKWYNEEIKKLCDENIQSNLADVINPELEHNLLEKIVSDPSYKKDLIKELEAKGHDIYKLGYDVSTNLLRYEMAKAGRVLEDDINGQWKIFSEVGDRNRAEKIEFANMIASMIKNKNSFLYAFFVEFENGFSREDGTLHSGYEPLGRFCTINRKGAGYVMFLYGTNPVEIHNKLIGDHNKTSKEDWAADILALVIVWLICYGLIKIGDFFRYLISLMR